MFYLFPSLVGILLVSASQVAGVCDNNQCESQVDPNKCVDLLATEELDCVSYTCKSRGGRLVLVKDETQAERCSINGDCYEDGEGPNECTYCQMVDGIIKVFAGCKKPNDTGCAAPGAQFADGCYMKQCLVQNHAARITTVGTIGCILEGKCYGVGEVTYRFTCNECSLKENKYLWYKECRDPRNNQCFPKGALFSIKCNTYICSNRRGVGWYNYSASHCPVSGNENDCVAANSTSLRDGYCYYCDEGGQEASVGCRACGQCLKPGETAECDGETVSCGNVADPPVEDDITCQIGDENVNVGATVNYQCNNYTCTKFGVRQRTANCMYEGKCYRAGEMMNEALCLRCVSDGATTTPEQGCKRLGKCIAIDETVRVNCVTKQCGMYGGAMELRPTEYQPTPCVHSDECYGVGLFHYGHDRTCAECMQNGTVILGCKLFNGHCLRNGEAESLPSKGCYRMQCINLVLEKVPGQPLRCEAPGDRCLEENEIAEIGGVKHFCVAQDKCIFNEEIVPIGEQRDYDCHRLVCQEVEFDGVKETEMVITNYGCPYADGQCIERGGKYIKNCDTYECLVPDGEIYATNELIINRCPCGTHCLEINSYLWTSDCAKMTCQESGEAVRTGVGCKSQLTSTCLTDGLTITFNGVTEVCEIGDDQALNNSLTATVTHCTFDGTMETVPYNGQTNRSCNTWTCEKRNGVISLYIVGQPRCKSGTGEDAVCVAAGDTYDCGTCEYNMDSPTSHRVTYKQTQCRRQDGPGCVLPGEAIPMSPCINAVCDANTLQLNKTNCVFGSVCLETGSYTNINYNGGTISCTCEDPANNKIQCK